MSDNHTDPHSSYVWYNELSRSFLEKDYLLPGQTLDERVNIICQRAEATLGIKDFAARFKANIQRGWYSLSTPIWSNFGTERGLPISCFSSYIDDTMASILETHAEVGMMTKLGGGTSAYFGDLRGRGDPISNNGASSGSVHFMQLFDSLINVVSQGSTRRGNFAAYLPIDHKDIEEFLRIRSEGHPIQDISFGVCVPDYWLNSMIEGDEAKRKIWARVLEVRAHTGYPYIFFTDNVNNGKPEVYKDKEMTIHSSNLCVTGDQLVVTSKGMKRVKDLYDSGEDLVLFDGDKSVNASPMKLIEKDVPIYQVTTFSGRKHKMTSYHKIKTTEGMIEASNLKVGDRVYLQRNQGLFGSLHDPKRAFLLGLYQGDGTQTDKLVFLDVWENDFDLLDSIEQSVAEIYEKENWTQYAVTMQNGKSFTRPAVIPTFHPESPSQNGVEKRRLQSTKLKQWGFAKGSVPQWVWDSDQETQGNYLKGLYFADGTVYVSKSQGQQIQLSLASIDKKFLEEIQIMLSNHGINTSIYDLKKAGFEMMPDGKGGQKLYPCQDCYRLCISNKTDALKFESLTGFLTRKKVYVEDREYRDNRKKTDEIVKIEILDNEDVYCTTVDSGEHVWVCNSFITSNCSEVCLPTNLNESFVCDLGSMNVIHFDEWKNTDAVELLTFFLDAVMTEFIDKAEQIPFMERAVRFAKRHRALGIGWIGWHSYLQSKMIAWESMEAKYTNIEVAKTIKDQAYKASAKLAKLFGEPLVLMGYGRRNTTLLAIAPTKSSSFILGQASEGIEPYKTNYDVKDLQKGKFSIKNKYLEQLLESKGLNTAAVWSDILHHGGSVQHMNELSPTEKAVFKTFAEISPKEIIIQAAQRQRHIDQSQSLNLMIHPEVPIKDVNALILEAWRLGVKTLYYQFSVNAAQQFSRNILNCSSCEA